MSDEKGLPNENELLQLSPNAIATYAIRCALRVQPMWTLWNKSTAEYKKEIVDLNSKYKVLVYNTDNVAARTAAKSAARTTEDSVFTTKAADVSRVINAALAAVSAATRTAANATSINAAAINSANAAARIITDNDYTAADAYAIAINSARTDYRQLLELKTEVTDASETGPLGDLWHGSPPDWYIKAKEECERTIVKWERDVTLEDPPPK